MRKWSDRLSSGRVGTQRCEDVSGDKWLEHHGAGHLGTQSCEDVSGESGRTIIGQGISEVRVPRMSQAKVARSLQVKTSGSHSCEDTGRNCSRNGFWNSEW